MIAALWLSLAGCLPAVNPSLDPDVVGFSGCDVGSCALGSDGALLVWTSSLPDAVYVDGHHTEFSAEPAESGSRIHLTGLEHASAVELRWKDRRWKVELGGETAAPVLAAAAAVSRGAWSEVEGLLGPLNALDNVSRARAQMMLARAAISDARSESALGLLEQARAGFLAAGFTREVVFADLLRADVLARNEGHLQTARGVLDGLPATRSDDLDLLRAIAFARCLQENLGANPRAAIPACTQAELRAAQLGRGPQVATAARQLAVALGRAGRFGDAVSTLTAIPLPSDPCSFQALTNDLAWTVLMVREAEVSLPGMPDPTTLLQEGLAQMGGACKQTEAREANAYVNLALASLQAGDLTATSSYLLLVQARSSAMSWEVSLWSELVAGRTMLALDKSAQALEAASLLQKHAEGRAIDLEWRGARLRAQALTALGRKEEAAAAWSEATDLMIRNAALIPVHVGRDAFLAEQLGVARAWVSTLLELGRTREAMDVVRRHRNAALRSESQVARFASLSGPDRSTWEGLVEEYQRSRAEVVAFDSDSWAQLPGQADTAVEQRADLARRAAELLDRSLSVPHTGAVDLRGPRPGELLLTWFPLQDGWVGFASDSVATVAVRVPAPDLGASADQLAAQLLTPFAEFLRRADRVTLLPYGVLRAVDLHVLPFEGLPLVARVPVSYGLDLPRPPEAVAGPAVVVADPRADLPGARAEGRAAAEALGAELRAGDDAHRDRVLADLSEAGLLYFAGHARRAPEAVDSALLLANSSELTVGDILAAPRVPQMVVLSACATADAGEPPIEGLGLAQAFLVAGARVAVATFRPVRDETAQRFGASLLAADLSDPARAWQAAVLDVRNATPEADWASFRLYEP